MPFPTFDTACIRATPRQEVGDFSHALIGVSLFNSYYSTPRLIALIDWAARTFEQSHVAIFDVPHAYTLAAQRGHAEGAVRRARKEGKKLRNKVTRIIAEVAPDSGDRLHLLAWDDLMRNDEYLTLRVEVELAFCTDPVFRDACLAMAGTLLDGDDARSAAAAMLGVRYLLDELPLFIDSSRIVGSESSVFLYHQAPALFRDLFANRFSLRPADRQGFTILTEMPAEIAIAA
jgi:cyclo(L-tyrosyl-L-tyrosyl) synthase